MKTVTTLSDKNAKSKAKLQRKATSTVSQEMQIKFTKWRTSFVYFFPSFPSHALLNIVKLTETKTIVKV